MRSLAGIVLAAMIVLTITSAVTGLFSPLWAGAASWIAAALLLRGVSMAQRIQVGVMIGAGLIAVWYAMSRGGTPDLSTALDKNHALITMLASIGFLRLVTLPRTSASERKALPVGPGAMFQSFLNVATFGAVINMTSALLVLDRLELEKSLNRFSTKTISRIFSGCSGWSPFYGGMAVVIVYVAGADLSQLILGGLPLAIIGFAVTWFMAMTFDRSEVDSFVGVPFDVRNLWLPATLALIVFALYFVLQDSSILVVIAIGALLLTAVVLTVRGGPASALRDAGKHIVEGLPTMSGELYLFLAAGFLAMGLSALLQVTGLTIPLDNYSARSASIVLAAIVALSMIGLHPLIPISTVTPFLLPLDPSPNLLGITYLFAWSLGTAGSWLSGTHLIFQGRYGVSSWWGARKNWPFVAVMLIVAIALLHLYDHFGI